MANTHQEGAGSGSARGSAGWQGAGYEGGTPGAASGFSAESGAGREYEGQYQGRDWESGEHGGSQRRSLRTNGGALMNEFRNVIHDVEEFLQKVTGISGEEVGVARDRMQAKLREASTRLDEASRSARVSTRQAAAAADEYVHQQPWAVVGAAAVTGLLVGLLVARR